MTRLEFHDWIWLFWILIILLPCIFLTFGAKIYQSYYVLGPRSRFLIETNNCRTHYPTCSIRSSIRLKQFSPAKMIGLSIYTFPNHQTNCQGLIVKPWRVDKMCYTAQFVKSYLFTNKRLMKLIQLGTI